MPNRRPAGLHRDERSCSFTNVSTINAYLSGIFSEIWADKFFLHILIGKDLKNVSNKLEQNCTGFENSLKL